MSFASEVKAELCRIPVGGRTLAVAECCGVMLFCHTFTPREIRIVTASGDFAERLPKLIKRASGAVVQPAERSGGRLEMKSRPGTGTTISLILPEEGAANDYGNQ